MSFAHLARLVIGLVGGSGVLAVLVWTHPIWLALPMALVLFIATSLIAQRVFQRYATADEIRRDLEDRVRNPPS